MTTSSDAFAEALIREIKLMPPITRRAYGQAFAERDGRDLALWHALGALVASVNSTELAGEQQMEHDVRPDLAAGTQPQVEAWAAEDAERIAGWPAVDAADLPEPGPAC